jgi:hypothetical protein
MLRHSPSWAFPVNALECLRAPCGLPNIPIGRPVRFVRTTSGFAVNLRRTFAQPISIYFPGEIRRIGLQVDFIELIGPRLRGPN